MPVFSLMAGRNLSKRPFGARRCRHWGIRLDWLGPRELNRGLILSDDVSLVVVFRGTRLHVHNLMDMAELVIINQSDLWIDSLFLPAVCQAGGRVHSGFLGRSPRLATSSTRSGSASAAGRKVWLTGHSLGGALATLAAAHLGQMPTVAFIPYGCPRVGDAKFTSVLPEMSHFRFVHREDWVVNQPPELLGYVHGGMLSLVLGAPAESSVGESEAGSPGLERRDGDCRERIARQRRRSPVHDRGPGRSHAGLLRDAPVERAADFGTCGMTANAECPATRRRRPNVSARSRMAVCG